MESILKEFNQNPFVLSVLAVCTVFSLISGIYFYIKSNKRHKMFFIIRGQNIYTDSRTSQSDIKVLYKDREVPNLTVSRFYIYNWGNSYLDFDSMSNLDSMRVQSKSDSVQILDLSIIDSGKSSKFIKIDEKCVDEQSRKIVFDYIPPKDGFILQVFHTGNDTEDVLFLGKTKDEITWRKAEYFVKEPYVFYLIFILIFYSFFFTVWFSQMGFQRAIVLVALSLIFILPLSYFFPYNRYTNPSMPSQFRKFL